MPTPENGGECRREAHRRAAPPRRGLCRGQRPCSLRAGRGDCRRAGRDARVPTGADGGALRRRRGAGDDRARDRRKARSSTRSPRWEYFFAAYSHAERGDFERAIADMNEGLAEQPDSPPLHYHLACIESQGRPTSTTQGDISTEHSSSIPLCASGPTRTRISLRSGVPRKPEPGRERAERRNGIGLRPRDDEQRAVRLHAERLDEQLQARRERERLVRLLAAEGDEIVRRRRARRSRRRA